PSRACPTPRVPGDSPAIRGVRRAPVADASTTLVSIHSPDDGRRGSGQDDGDMKPPMRLDVYVITSAGLWPGRGHREVALAAIEGRASAVQLRAPELEDDPLAMLAIARELAARCREAGALFVVDNVVEVALRS